MRVGSMASSLYIFIHFSPPTASILFLPAHFLSVLLFMRNFSSLGEGINTLALCPKFPLLYSPQTHLPYPSSPVLSPFTIPQTSSTLLIHLRDFADKYLPSPPPSEFSLFFSLKQSVHTLLFQSFPSISCSRVIVTFNSLSDFAYKYPRPPSPQLCSFFSQKQFPYYSSPLLPPPCCRFTISVSIHFDSPPIYIFPFLPLSTSLLNYTVPHYLLNFLKVINFSHFLLSLISRFRSLILYTKMSPFFPLPTCLLHPNLSPFLRGSPQDHKFIQTCNSILRTPVMIEAKISSS